MSNRSVNLFEPVVKKVKLWKEANDLRGRGYTDMAKDFVRAHPVGTVLTKDTFDQWLEAQGRLNIPPQGTSKDSDAWMGHLQRRHIQKTRLNSAATHPRMTEEGSTPFILTAIRNGLEVRSPQEELATAELPRKISTLTETQRKKLAYLMQSGDWEVLPPHERAIAEEVYVDIKDFAEDAAKKANRIVSKISRLQKRMQDMIDRGEIQPRNGGIRRLLAPQHDTDLLDEDDSDLE